MADDNDPRRRFSKTERLGAWLAQDGRSAISGEPLGTDFHADHRIPHSKGGPTSIENCDAVTPEENLRKGARMNRYRWQDEFIQKYLAHPEPNFFLCALPGAGKTRAAIRVIRAWIDQGGTFIAAVPTLPVRKQWRDNLQKAGIYADAKFYGALRDGYHGGLVTYAGIHSLTGAFKKFCQDRPVLLIADEIHHASESENSTWGTDLRESFGGARRRLLLSGTPVRSDRETTSFLKIVPADGGPQYEMHFLYDWPRALADKVVRAVTFHRLAMDNVVVQFERKGQVTFSAEDEAWLNYALDDNKFVLLALRKAIDCLEGLRREDPSAAGLVTAKHIGHANEIAKLLEMLGQHPIIVTSAEEENSVDVIDAFATDNSKKWIVSVKQVSEGVDVPRLRVLVYLTFYRTELIFRQFVGRVVRRRDDETDALAQAHVFIPECPSLTVLAERIEELQALAFKKKREGGEDPPERDQGHTLSGSEPEFVGYIIHGKRYEGDRAQVISQIMDRYYCSEETASRILADSDGLKFGETPKDFEEPQENPPWVDEELLKLDIKKLTNELVRLRKINRHYPTEYNARVYSALAREIHIETMVDGVSQTKMSVTHLRAKKEKLLELLMQEQRS